MEPQWNPMMEEQALCRVHRMGQKKEVTTIRYRMNNSFEEKVVTIQERKKDLAALTFSNEKISEADVGAARLQVSLLSSLISGKRDITKTLGSICRQRCEVVKVKEIRPGLLCLNFGN
jgi:hypothetical protein